MKTLLTLALMAAGVANAGTITLNPAGGFGALHQYKGVTTDAVPEDTVSMSLPQASTQSGMQLYFSSQYDYVANRFLSYYIGTYAGNGGTSILQKCVFVDQTTYDPCVLTGELIEVTITESSRVVRGSGSGRGGYARHTLWTLLGGTVTLP